MKECRKPYNTWVSNHKTTWQDRLMAQRGQYAKGIAKREEILTRSLDVIGREGLRGASVKEIAEAVGLSQAGLLHYFDSKEDLFVAILRKRDQLDGMGLTSTEPLSSDDMHSAFIAVMRRNSDVPGLVELFSRLAVDASDPAHPAHAYFIERGAFLRQAFGNAIREGQRRGDIIDTVDAEAVSRMLQAVADGLQVQWLLDPTVDMAAILEALFTSLTTTSHPVDD